MYRLVFRLFPYVLTLLGGLLLLTGGVAVLGEAEEEATDATITTVTQDAPRERWLNLTDGVLFIPGAVEDRSVNKDTGAKKLKRVYVPYVSSVEATARMVHLTAPQSGGAAADEASEVTAVSRELPFVPKMLVMVRFRPDDYLKFYSPSDKVSGKDLFKRVSVSGVRRPTSILPRRLKDFVRAELKLPLEKVVVIDYGSEPLQKGAAAVFAVIGAVLGALGLLWIRSRWWGGREPTDRYALDPLGPKGSHAEAD